MKSPSSTISPRDRLILALDFPTKAKALALVSSLAGAIGTYKIGLQLYTAEGPEIIRAVAATGANIFLDLKLHDIPCTIAKAVAAAGELGVQMLTVHLSGGRAMLSAAAAAKPANLSLLGVTVLTSATPETLSETGVNSGIEEQVLRLAELGQETGIDGLISSPHEVKTLRERFGQMKLITPGVRPSWTAAHDQKRFATPDAALKSGADYLVVGRPVTGDPDPRAAVERLLAEIAG
jgi:orotidine-5'-phosphate decarboxylase